MSNLNLPHWPGWHLIGVFESDVASWILHHGGEAALLELPEGLGHHEIKRALKALGSPRLKYAFASHHHPDHWEERLGTEMGEVYRDHGIMPYTPRPHTYDREWTGFLGGEPVKMLMTAKHSWTDSVIVFRGVAMTGDIELGTLASVNGDVSTTRKIRAMQFLRDFPERSGYLVHTTVSAHLTRRPDGSIDDVRTDVDWKTLFTYLSKEEAQELAAASSLVPQSVAAGGKT